MKKSMAVWTAVLVVSAGCGLARASTLTLSIDIANPQLSLDGSNGPTQTSYTVYGMITDNTTEDGFGNPQGILNGGFATFATDQAYTSSDGGQIASAPGAYPPVPGYKILSNAAIDSHFALAQHGYLLDADGTTVVTYPDTVGTGGVKAAGGAMSPPPGAYDYYTDQSPYVYGNGTPAPLYTGTIKAVADGTVNISVDVEYVGTLYQAQVWQVDVNGLKSVPVDSVIPATATITVAPVPEPATLGILCFGAVGLLKRNRRRTAS